MNLYRIYNGFTGFDAVHALACAQTEQEAIELARPMFVKEQPSAGQTGSTCSGVMYKDNRHGDLMQHFRGFLSGPNRCPGCAGHGITDRGTTCKACLGDGKLTSAVRGRVEWFGGARLPEPDAPLV